MQIRPLIVTVGLLVALGASGCGLPADERFEQASTVAPVAERLTVRTDSGEVDVTAAPDGDVHVVARVSHRGERPQLVEESTPDGVLLEARCPTGPFVSCTVDYEVQVPPAFAVQVASGSGAVRVGAVSGPVAVETGSGDIAVTDVSGDLTLRTGSGGVEGSGVRSAATAATTGSGDVRLVLLAPPTEVRAETSSGEVEVAVPGDRAYRVETDSGSGEQQVGVPVDAAAPGSIRAVSGSGDVTVRAS